MSDEMCTTCKVPLVSHVLETFHDTLLGLPGGVYLHDAVEVTECPTCGARESVAIPNLYGLVASVAVWRVRQPAKLDGPTIRFLRKAMERSAGELAEDLTVRPETVSRWENGREPIGPTNERLFRVLVATRLRERAPAITGSIRDIAELKPQPLQTVAPPHFHLVFVVEDEEEEQERTWGLAA